MAGIRSVIKSLASLQEVHYSDHYTYTQDLDVLFGEARGRMSTELEVDILFAGTQGWAGLVTHPESGGRCVLAYGYFVPMGWQPGAIICL